MIPVNVITGFLGSGKTTLLREILRHPDYADAAVIVNEFGEIGLDHILLEEVEEGVLLLENGCVCCTIRSDLQETIRGLQDNVAAGRIAPFRRVFVETTGLADPAPIVSTVLAEPVIRNHFRIGNIVCTVDALTGAPALEKQPEAVKQIAVADRILITKTDLVEAKQARCLEDAVRRLNPLAAVRKTKGQGFDASFLFGQDVGGEEGRALEVSGWLENIAHLPDHQHDHQHDHDHSAGAARAFNMELNGQIDWTAFGIWLTALLHAHGERILRVKGILNVQESLTPVIIHGVQHVVHPPLHLAGWPDETRTSRLIFITRGIDEARIRASLGAFLELAAEVGGHAERRVLEGADIHG